MNVARGLMVVTLAAFAGAIPPARVGAVGQEPAKASPPAAARGAAAQPAPVKPGVRSRHDLWQVHAGQFCCFAEVLFGVR